MRILFVMAVLAAALLVAPASADIAPVIEWQQLLGGDRPEDVNAVVATDGGYLAGGSAHSSADGDVAGASHGPPDIWLVQLGPLGGLQGQKLLGGDSVDFLAAVNRTSDGGYVLVGSTVSDGTGDVAAGNHGGFDLWVVKLGPLGMVQKQLLLGGSGDESAVSVVQTSDGGYVVLGYTDSSRSGDVAGTNHGAKDIWVVRLDILGNVAWQRLLGGSGRDVAADIRQTADGGFVVLGYTDSSASGNLTRVNHGGYDIWVAKLDPGGAIEGQVLLGGSGDDYASQLRVTADNGYIVAGGTRSSASGDVRDQNHGQTDIWVVKLDAAGAIQAQRSLGGSGYETCSELLQTADGGFLIAGSSNSSASGDVLDMNHGDFDAWMVRLGPGGATRWQRLLGGAGFEAAYSAVETADGGYVFAAVSSSSASGDVTGVNHGTGTTDIWMVKLAGTAAPVVPVPPGTTLPTDPDGDRLYDDVNGNGRADFADVVLFFDRMDWVAANEPVSAFDYNTNGRIDFADVVWLFNRL
jgi:PKD repeat protein